MLLFFYAVSLKIHHEFSRVVFIVNCSTQAHDFWMDPHTVILSCRPSHFIGASIQVKDMVEQNRKFHRAVRVRKKVRKLVSLELEEGGTYSSFKEEILNRCSSFQRKNSFSTAILRTQVVRSTSTTFGFFRCGSQKLIKAKYFKL